jgi:hypothetical protein
MITRKIIGLGLITTLFLIFAFGCSSQKDVAERRNFMMPKKSEMARNSHYKETGNHKTNKIYTDKSKRKSLF